jgi:hypothetical protein
MDLFHKKKKINNFSELLLVYLLLDNQKKRLRQHNFFFKSGEKNYIPAKLVQSRTSKKKFQRTKMIIGIVETCPNFQLCPPHGQ